MAVFRDLHYGRYIPQYANLPIQAYDALGQTLETEYNKNLGATDELSLGLKQLQVRDVNQPILDEIAGEVNTVIDSLQKEGDYENAGRKIRSLATKVAGDKRLQGALQDKSRYDAYIKQLDERYQKGELSPDRYEAAKQMAMGTNKNMLQYDPITGKYSNMWDAYNPMKSVDVSKKIREFTDKIKSSSQPIQFGKDKAGNPIMMTHVNNQYFVTGSQEALSEDQAMGLIASYVASDPEIASYLQEGIKFDTYKNRLDATGQLRPLTAQDIIAFDPTIEDEAKKLGINLNALPQEVLDELYHAGQMQNAVKSIAQPYAQAAAFNKVKYDYHKDNEYLTRLNKGLELNNALKRIAAEGAKDKDVALFKHNLDKIEKEKEKYANTLSTPIQAEAFFEPRTNSKTIDELKGRLAQIDAAKTTGLAVSQEVLNEETDLKNQLQVRQAQQEQFMNEGASSTIGSKYIDEQWKAYVENNPNPTITESEFKHKVITGDFSEPKTEQAGYYYSPTNRHANIFGIIPKFERDPYDVNTYLTIASENIKYDDGIVTNVNKKLSEEANVLTSSYTGAQLGKSPGNVVNNEKSNYVDIATQMVSQQILANDGIGYTVMGSGKSLNDTLAKLKIDSKAEETDEKGTKTGKYIFIAQPLDKPQVTRTNDRVTNDVMYNLVVKDAKTGETKFQGRVRPNDQQVHNDLFIEMNNALIEAKPGTEIARRAEISNAILQHPEFDLFSQNILLSGIKPEDGPEHKKYGTVIHKPGQGKFVYISSNQYVDSEQPTNGAMIVNPKVKQEVVQLIRLKDDTPNGLTINNNNIKQYLFQPEAGIDGNALLQDQYIQNPNLANTLLKNGVQQATYFKSTQDALLSFARRK